MRCGLFGWALSSIATGDFNSDGIADLAVTEFCFDGVSVLLGKGSHGVGDGTFAAALKYSAGQTSIRLATGDFNSDGITDLATANLDGDNVTVLINLAGPDDIHWPPY